ncbi:DUF7544 domain-containing protein [Allostreptomyces psammosilenae]|uniref:DUF7847 domain-containing protein n=1 Tax=Allostreptomyces psammosilenae TaxID=1892865 RepID=A0A853A662_9ACTN|nr:glycerophosphoryl diester phosphodiesterase membrane domain-containing protein [Allostreptomyces psammosilenae]NYI06171.1 hypothetical protein [Allostreptomyces psammosilenae]
MTDTPGWASPGGGPGERPPTNPGAPGAGPPADRAPSEGPGHAPGTPPGGPGAATSGQWSGQQPPPSGWGPAPGDPAPGGPAAGPGGWNTTGWNPAAWQQGGAPGGGWGAAPTPPSPKPGIIPLRPLGVGEILDGTITAMRRHWRTVLGISFVVSVLSAGLQLAVMWFGLRDFLALSTQDPTQTEDLDEVMGMLGGATAGALVAVAVSLIATAIASGLLTVVISRAVLGRDTTIGEAWRDAAPQVFRLLGLTLLTSLITYGAFLVGMLPTIGIPVALAAADAPVALTVITALVFGLGTVAVSVWLYVKLLLAVPALMLEKQGVGRALSRSWRLTRRSWWRLFGIFLLSYVLAGIVAELIAVIPSLVGTIMLDPASFAFMALQQAATALATAITMPIIAGVTVLLYVDQRIRREALDLELARTAGVPLHEGPQPPAGPGTPGPGHGPTWAG